jgi:hypothetical protein
VVKIIVHSALTHDALFLRYRWLSSRVQAASQVEKTPKGQHHLVAIHAADESIVQLILADPEVTLLPHRGSPAPLADASVAKLAHLGTKKGDTMHAALSKVYALTQCAAFHPDLG